MHQIEIEHLQKEISHEEASRLKAEDAAFVFFLGFFFNLAASIVYENYLKDTTNEFIVLFLFVCVISAYGIYRLIREISIIRKKKKLHQAIAELKHKESTSV